MSFTCQVLALKAECISRQEIALTDEHIRMLKKWFSKFRKANPGQRKKVIAEAAECIEGVWMEDIRFNKDKMIEVRDLSVKLGYSQHFLAYFRTFLRQRQTNIPEMRVYSQKMDVPPSCEGHA